MAVHIRQRTEAVELLLVPRTQGDRRAPGFGRRRMGRNATGFEGRKRWNFDVVLYITPPSFVQVLQFETVILTMGVPGS